MQAIAETVFDIIYLTLVITVGIQMILKSHGNKQYKLFGIMAVTLGAGDAFHLIPRAVALCTTGLRFLYRGFGNRKMDHLHHHDHLLCPAVLCMANPIQDSEQQQHYLGRLPACSSKNCALYVPTKCVDTGRRSAFLGHLSQHSVCPVGTAHHHFVLPKRKTEQRPRFCLDVAFHCTQLWILYSCGTLGRQHPINWYADDSKNLCLCLGCFDGIFRYAPS